MKRFPTISLLTVLVVAATLSVSLLLKHLDIPFLDTCSFLAQGACDEALASDFAVQFGIPLAGWGLVYFVLVGGLWAMGVAFPESFAPVATTSAFLVTSAGVVYSSVLLVLMGLGSIPFCPICVLIHLLNLTLPLLILWAGRLSIAEVLPGISVALSYLMGAKVRDEEKARWNLAGLFLVLLMGLVCYQWILLEYRPAEEPVAPDPDSVWTGFQEAPRHEFQLTMNDPVRGSNQATVELVIFSDFQCPYCKSFAAYLEPLIARYSSQLRVAFFHFPLSPQCNPALSQEMHPLACQAAWLAQAAHEMGRFWEVHDQFFASDLKQLSDLQSALQQLGLDPEEVQQRARSSKVQEKVRADIRLGLELELPGTPTVFLNGRHVQDARQLEYLLERLSRESPDGTLPARR